jgi:ATP-dependent exoDNAse (exonuclease V) beta subunit
VTLVDAAARARIRDDLDTTLVVEAAAGTGKTTELIARLLSVLRSGRARLDRVALVTFTDKAAGEMKLRLRTELERALHAARARGSAEERAHFEQALSALELAHIDTIHGFCADLLRERPIEAGVDPCFAVLDDFAAARLREEVFDAWFSAALREPPAGVRRVLRRGAGSRNERFGPKQQLFDAARALIEQRDFDAPWSAPAYDRELAIDLVVQGIASLGELAHLADDVRSSDYVAIALCGLRDFARDVAAGERTRARDYDALEAQLIALAKRDAWWKRKGGGAFAAGLSRDTVLARRAELRGALDAFLALAEADLAHLLQRELRQVVEAYEARKQKAGVLDFVDLLRCTRDLLRDDARARSDLQRRFSHVFVDEFQDIDPVQAEILLQLASAPDAAVPRVAAGKLFAVGDPKQSIYRFRRADVSMYERMKQALLRDGAELLQLTTSFRALPAIQAVVNAAFAPQMQGGADAAQAAYVPLSPSRAARPEHPALLALPALPPGDELGPPGRLHKGTVEAWYPKAVAAFVAYLLNDSGLLVEENGAQVPVAARHVCLLFKRFQKSGEDLTRGYVRELEARRIPHVLVGGRSLHGREEVIALRAALSAIEWPDDALSVYATLHGPFFAILDRDLLCFQAAGGHLHPLRPLPAEIAGEHAAVAGALALLRELHKRRNRRGAAQTIIALLEATRAHAGVAIWPTGEQALANLLSVVDAARNFDRRAAASFRGFVEWLSAQSESGTGSEAPIVEEGTEGVRLMTVHKAKGLEFPVVVLCDPTAPIEPRFPSRYVDAERRLWAQRLCDCRPLELQRHEDEVLRHDRAENVRVAYVAATRARDVLAVPVVDDTRRGKPVMGWTDALAPAAAAAFAPYAPRFRVPLEDLEAVPIGGIHIQQQRLLSATERSPRWVAEHEAWADARAQTLARAATATRAASPATQLARARAEALAAEGAAASLAPRGDADAVGVEVTARVLDGRPRGARFGTLVHAVLAQVPFGADAGGVRQLAVACGRLLGADAAEIDAAVPAVCAALAHPLMQRAARAADCRREVPIAHALAGGTLVEGVIDLAFREGAGWIVVDFKTDAVIAAQGAYAEQVRLYMDAVRAATGEPALGVLLGV